MPAKTKDGHMKERTRQQLLVSGQGVTLTQAQELLSAARYSSWSGCMTGADWCGVKVWRGGEVLNSGEHQQNDAPTGWEQRGRHTITSKSVLQQGDKLIVVRRFASGRNLDGDTFYTSSRKDLVIV